MVSFLSFLTISMASMAVASVVNDVGRRELGMESNLKKRATFDCSNLTQLSFISDSYFESKTLANIAFNYISVNGTTDAAFRAYFGDTNSPQPAAVFTAVSNENSPPLQLSCTDPLSRCDVLISYTNAGNIYYCPDFLDDFDTAQLCSGKTYDPSEIRGTVTLEQMTSLLSGTGEYGDAPLCSAAQQLVLDDPDLALKNADNYSCFAMWTYVQTQC